MLRAPDVPGLFAFEELSRACRVICPNRNRSGSEPMPILLWLLGVPLGLVILLVLLGVV
jgi:hypothetical protein